VSFALWWALTTLPGGIWPSFGSSGTYGATQWWMQSAPAKYGGRPQVSLQRHDWSLRYGPQAQGWAWQLSRSNVGIWWIPGRTLGLTGSFRGRAVGSPWTASAAASRENWTAHASWKGYRWFRSYQGIQGFSAQRDLTRLEVQWGPQWRSIGLSHGDLSWRRSTSPLGATELVRLRRGVHSAEWRSTRMTHGTQHQLGLRTQWGKSRLWVQWLAQNGSAQTMARASYSHPDWGSGTLGFSGRQPVLRYTLPNRGALGGSFIEWSSVLQLSAAHRNQGLSVSWDPRTGQWNIQLSGRHTVRPVPRPTSVAAATTAPCWLDVSYQFSGQPPSVELTLRGRSDHRVVLVSQDRQWKDHVPPGRYAVTGTAPKGWALELPTDSLTLRAGEIAPLWIALKPHHPRVRWVSGQGESPE